MILSRGNVGFYSVFKKEFVWRLVAEIFVESRFHCFLTATGERQTAAATGEQEWS